MEQKQSLWIIAAIGVFLLVVVGAALILYSPSSKKDTLLSETPQAAPDASIRQSGQGYVDSWFNQSGAAPETAAAPPPVQLQPTMPQAAAPQASMPLAQGTIPQALVTAPDGSIIPVSPQNPQYQALLQALNMLSQIPQGTSTGTPSSASATATVTIPPQYPAAPQSVTDLTVISGTTHVIGTGVTTVTGTQAPQTAAAPVQAASATAAPAAPAAATPKPAPAPVKAAAKAPDQYWVQAASFSAKKNADLARGVLEAQKMPGEVFTFTGADGKTYYRVRLGPYETKQEAEFWQGQLRQMKNFEKSQTFVLNSAKN